MIKSFSLFLTLVFSNIVMAQGTQSALFATPKPSLFAGLSSPSSAPNLFAKTQPVLPERAHAESDAPASEARNDDSLAPIPYANMRWASYERVTFDGHTPLTKTEIKPIGLAITSAVYAGGFIALHIYESNAWWSTDRAAFHFEEDWPENLQNDKFGHFFGAYYMSYFSREALLQCGLSDEASHDYGALMGGLYQFYVETNDGYSKSWGFSPTDASADLLGAAYFFAQYHIPVLQNFHEKWSYWPSQFLGSGSIPGQKRTILDDYNGQSFWWSVDVWNLLPESAQQWWPKWLEVALGYTARKWEPYLGNTPAGQASQVVDSRQYTDVADTREIYISLDYNLMNLLPKTNIPFLNWLIQTADNIHFPAPAIRLTPKFQAFIAFPFQLQLGNFWF
ncbi:MAG TPA: DUF2279 domain-containing protein [Candidatus Kapabacteria bacterium]|nr:DUF2279 domain-containing protein [Candidatus Kapabacteria bacterium]